MPSPVAISDDARTIVLLCSSVAASRAASAKPLGPAGWAKMAARLVDRGVPPGALLGMSVTGSGGLTEILGDLELNPEDTGRQLERSAHLGFELERLASRGIAILTVIDDSYPARLRDRLGPKAPPVLFTAGDASILDAGGVAIVGSRDVDPAGASFAESVASAAARENRVVVSGGARGVDQVAMAAAFAAGGRVAGLLPEGIERRLREPSTRAALAAGQVALASPYNPTAPFSAGAAMGRNKLIYALADVAVIVASAAESGGTWAGAVEAMKAKWVPVYVRTGPGAPAGNERLIEAGARPLSSPEAPPVEQPHSMEEAPPEAHRAAEELRPVQRTLFD